MAGETQYIPTDETVREAIQEPVKDRLGEAQLLTGRAAPSRLAPVSLSPTKLAWRRLKKNRLAVLGGWILIVLYTIALFAPFISPYSATSQDPDASLRPPMRLHFLPWPTSYHMSQTFNEYRERVYAEDHT